MKSVLMSIKPEYCELIAAGIKTVEVRKSKPQIKTPFKCYIYCTKQFYKNGDGYFQGKYCGKVIGEFVCDKIDKIVHAGTSNENVQLCTINDDWLYRSLSNEYLSQTKLTYGELEKYSNGGNLYGWHISDLVIYDEPKELSEFMVIDKGMLKECTYRIRAYNNPDCTNGALLKGTYVCNNSFEPDFCRGQCGIATKPLIRPPQSWCYVEVEE